MEQIGITTDGKKVMKDIAKMYFQDGLPLSILFDLLSQNNMIPSWLDLYEGMKQNGMSHKRIIHLMHEHMFDTYGGEFRDRVIKKLENEYCPLAH